MCRMMRQERINRGWSREYVAQKIGLTSEAVRLLEAGERNPSYSVLVNLEDLFQMNYRELFKTGSNDER